MNTHSSWLRGAFTQNCVHGALNTYVQYQITDKGLVFKLFIASGEQVCGAIKC
jgi:hypothetical protein